MWTSPPVEVSFFLVFHLLSQVHWRQKQLELEWPPVAKKRYWTLPKSRGSQSSEWAERKKIGAKRGSLCEPCKPHQTMACPRLRVVEPVYHQASLRGRWRSFRTSRRSAKERRLGGGAPCESRKTVPSSLFHGLFLFCSPSILFRRLCFSCTPSILFHGLCFSFTPLLLFHGLCYFFVLPCQQANAAGALGASDRRAVDGFPC